MRRQGEPVRQGKRLEVAISGVGKWVKEAPATQHEGQPTEEAFFSKLRGSGG